MIIMYVYANIKNKKKKEKGGTIQYPRSATNIKQNNTFLDSRGITWVMYGESHLGMVSFDMIF